MDICLCQFGNSIGDNVYIPYSIGCIVAYCQQFDDGYNYRMLYVKKDIGVILDEIGTPDVLAISTYIWNHEYNMEVAKEFRKRNPNAIIIIGGHNIDGYDENIFKKYPFIDKIINGEGEKAFYHAIKPDLPNINLSININGENHITKNQKSNLDLDEIPSPYLSGVFDEIMKEPYNFTASLESNRGCPYQCAYCDWGSFKTSNKKMRLFDLDRVFGEIEWFGKHKIEFLFGCDSNFGLYLERDMKIIDKIIEVKKKYGYPEKFRVCYAKNSNEVVFQMNKKLNEYELSKGATLSFQSINPETTKAIGRINLPMSEFNKYVMKYNQENIPVYTEMIIGLPEETYDSFTDGFDTLLNNHQHNNIVVYYCQVYPNSRLGDKEYQEKYGIKTVSIPMYPTHTIIDESQILEKEEIVISTNKAITQEWINISLFSWTVQTFHCLGITQLIAIHIKHTRGVDYKTFYNDLIDYVIDGNGNILCREFDKVIHIFDLVSKSKNGFKYIQDGLNYPVEEGSFIELIRNIILAYIDIYHFICKKYYKSKKDNDITQVLLYNKAMLNKFNDDDETIDFDYDFDKAFKEYFNTGVYKIEKKQKTIIVPASKKYESFKEWSKHVVWYGRKGGKTLKWDSIIQM